MSAPVEKLSYTIPEAANALGIGRTSLYELIAEKRLTPTSPPEGGGRPVINLTTAYKSSTVTR